MLDQTHSIIELPLVLHVGRQCIIQIGNVDYIPQIILECTLCKIFYLLDIINIRWLDVMIICASWIHLDTDIWDVKSWYSKDRWESLCYHLVVDIIFLWSFFSMSFIVNHNYILAHLFIRLLCWAIKYQLDCFFRCIYHTCRTVQGIFYKVGGQLSLFFCIFFGFCIIPKFAMPAKGWLF